MFKWASWPPGFTVSATPAFASDFPNLVPHLCGDDFSEETKDYNCFAWAASDTDARWEPDPLNFWYWPDGIERKYSLDAFYAAYRTIGYEICGDGSLEAGFEKIAIFTINGIPKHAARQLPNGNWTSKLGDFEDIQHCTLACLEGPLYGMALIYMKRTV
jgi:hypothetical protein